MFYKNIFVLVFLSGECFREKLVLLELFFRGGCYGWCVMEGKYICICD